MLLVLTDCASNHGWVKWQNKQEYSIQVPLKWNRFKEFGMMPEIVMSAAVAEFLFKCQTDGHARPKPRALFQGLFVSTSCVRKLSA